MTAWVSGFLGMILVFTIGLERLQLSALGAAWCVAASNIAGLAALLVNSFAHRTPWARRKVIFNPLATWIVFLGVYFGLELALSPALRDLAHFEWLVVPTILATGFAILIYGPIQDRLVSSRRTRR